jgi:hypothetical protein
MEKRKMLLIVFTNQVTLTLKLGGSTLSSLFSRLALLPSFLVSFYFLSTHTPRAQSNAAYVIQ